MQDDDKLSELDDLKVDLWSSLISFCQVFFPAVTGRDFIVERPDGREPHHITIAKELTKVANLETTSLLINVQPGSGKSVMLCMFVAWMISKHPDSNYIYVAYGHDLASSQTAFIKQIISCTEYRTIFGVQLRNDIKAKDFFQTTAGGTVRAFGSGGPVTGASAGYMIDQSDPKWTGCLILDDMTKPDQAASDVVRESILHNYKDTILQRPRGPHVPIICIAQRLHEDDICAHMLSGKDEREWKAVVLKSLDEAGNALCPSVTTKQQLLEKQKFSPYSFASQYQQDPSPAGGAVFKSEWFVLLDHEPEILTTFIVVDSAETDKNYNDATAFSFFGVYKLEGGQLALHWIDAWEIWVEPKDLEAEFKSFYTDCCRHKVKPLVAAIEKKSTGVTLISVLQDMRGLQIRDVKRTVASGSKMQRFLDVQSFVSPRLISLPASGKHSQMCVEHMSKITANNTHKRDDLADTLADGIRLALIEKSIYTAGADEARDRIAETLANDLSKKLNILDKARNAHNGYTF